VYAESEEAATECRNEPFAKSGARDIVSVGFFHAAQFRHEASINVDPLIHCRNGVA